MRKRGNAKVKRDQVIRKFANLRPHYTHGELGEKFGLTRSAISKILKKGEKDASHN